jgi:hypothetical protein
MPGTHLSIPTRRTVDVVPLSPDAEQKRRRRRKGCKPQPVAPKGGDAHHNWCADAVPPNRFPGQDVMVNGKNFDALGPGDVLWEVKTGTWSSYNPWLKTKTLSVFMDEITVEAARAEYCGYPFIVGVADDELLDNLSRRFARHGNIPMKHLPVCKRK